MAKALTILILIMVNSLTIFSQYQHEFHLDDYRPPSSDSPGGVAPGPIPYPEHFHAYPTPSPPAFINSHS